jgi:hypothetical protein
MTAEVRFVAIARTLCPRVHPITAPLSTPRPFIVYQHIGGQVLRHTDATASDKRHTMLQSTVWASTLAEALTLARALEEALCADVSIQAQPMGEVITQDDDQLEYFGALQDFSIVAPR